MKRPQQIVLCGAFLAIIGVVPISQAIIDVTAGGEKRPYVATLFGRAPSEKNLRDFEENLERISYYEQKIRPLFQLARFHVLGELGEKALRGAEPGWFYYTPGVRYLVEPFYGDRLQRPEHDPVAVIDDFSHQLERRGIALLVMPVPGKASIYPERLWRGVEPGPAISEHTRRAVEALRARGVQVIDLHRIFLAARQRRPQQALYMKADTHWTGDGARLAAETVAGRIRELPWYRRPAAPLYVRRQVTVTRQGDVPRMTQIPGHERLFAAEPVTCHRVFFASGEQAGEPYEEPDEPKRAQVLVLGDSFSRVFERDEPEAAGWISNLAFELQQPVTSIVNDGGASTLVRQALARDLSTLEGKKVVVWTFVERDLRFGLQGWQPIDLWTEERPPAGAPGASASTDQGH